MERYRFSWNPSPSAFVEKIQVVGKIDGGAEAVLVDSLPSSAFEAFYDFETGAVVEAWGRVVGDNATVADTAHLSFTAKNEEQVAPVEDFGVAWVQHIA
jgi:hypothetical protein